MLHKISNNVVSQNIDGFQYETKGILQIRFAIQQTFSCNAPLDTIFKIINTNENIPFTKLNPGVHREPMFRLYGEEKTKDNSPDGKGIVDVRKLDTTMGIAFWRKQKKDSDETFLSVQLSEYKVDNQINKDLNKIKDTFPESKVLKDDSGF